MKTIEITTDKGIYKRKAETLDKAVRDFMRDRHEVFIFAEDVKFKSITKQFKHGSTTLPPRRRPGY